MSARNDRTCLVLASRHALDSLGPAIDLALASLELTRVFPPPPDRVLEGLGHADVILGEVSKPSPAVSFELGVAVARGIPTVFFATAGAQVSPVFGPVLKYDPGESTSRLAFDLAKQLERALADDAEAPRRVTGEGYGQESTPRRYDLQDRTPAPEQGATAPAGLAYQVGEKFEAPIVHVNSEAGFVLVGTPGRRPAMLHVTNMSDPTTAAMANDALQPGHIVLVEVLSVDPRRRQVQVTDLGLTEPGAHERSGSYTDPVAQLLGEWALIEDRLRGEIPPSGPSDDGALDRFAAVFEDELRLVRQVRNRVAHGEPVPPDQLELALSYTAKLLGTLESAGWIDGSRTR